MTERRVEQIIMMNVNNEGGIQTAAYKMHT